MAEKAAWFEKIREIQPWKAAVPAAAEDEPESANANHGW